MSNIKKRDIYSLICCQLVFILVVFILYRLFDTLIVIAGFILPIVLLLIIKLVRKSKRISLFQINLIAMIISIVIFFFWIFIDEEITFSNRKKLINGIEEYYQNFGQYPKKIELLSPHILKKIPKPSFLQGSKHFTYRRYGAKRFKLSYLSVDSIILKIEEIYDSDTKKWISDD